MKKIISKQYVTMLGAVGICTLTACGGAVEAPESKGVMSGMDVAIQSEALSPNRDSALVTLSSDISQEFNDATVIAASEDMEDPASADADVVENGSDLPAPPVDIVETPGVIPPAFNTTASLPENTHYTVLAKTSAVRILDESFDGTTMSGFGAAVIKDEDVYLVKGKGVNGSNAIKVNYRGNSQGSDRVIVNYKLPHALQYTLSFDVNFCTGFDFRKGGKMHGLGPANPVAGGKEVSSPRWSARSMFRREGGLQSYIYSQNMAGKYGDVVIAKDFSFQAERYYAVTFQVALNQPAAASNGYMRVLVDGTPVIDHRNIKFRATESLESQISTLMFNTFHGGHTSDWAPRNTDGTYAVNCAYFDNFSASPSLEVRSAPGE
jgi:hypothetical protein